MKIKLNAKNNIILIDGNGKAYARIPSDWSLGRDIYKNPHLFYASPDGSSSNGIVFEWKKITHLIKGGAETAFTGTDDELFSELSDNFFFKVGGGGTTDASSLSSGTLSDDRLSNDVARVSKIKTINGNSIVGTGDITIDGEPTTDASDLTTGIISDLLLSNNIVFTNKTQTLTNKTLSSPVINSPTGITKSNVGLGNVDNTSDATKPVSLAQASAIALKANLASPALTGTPTAPTAVNGTNTNQVATTAFVLANAAAGGAVTLTGAQTLTNKTLSNPVLSQPLISGIVGAVGNGVADDTTALQNAIYFAGDNKRILQLPAGTFLIKSQIVLNEPNIIIRGAGIGKTIIKIASDYSGTGAAFISYGKSNITIEDIEITGNAKMIEAAIRFNSYANPDTQSKKVYINRVSIHDFWGIGVLFGSTTETPDTHSIDEVTISNCYLYNIGNPSQITTYTDGDIKYDAINLNSTTKRSIITNNYISRVSGDGIFSWGRVQSTPNPDYGNCLIESNHIELCWMHVEINGNYLARGLKINNNLLKYSTRNGGYSLSVDSDHASVTNNTIYSIDRAAIEYTAIGGIITGNTVEIRPYSATSGGVAPTALVDNANFIEAYAFENLISNNNFTFPVGRTGAGTFTPTQYRGIKIVYKTTDPSYQQGTYDGISDYAAYWNIKGNIISGFTHRAIDCTNEKIRKVFIQGNTFRSRFAVESVIPIYGYDWIIKDNIFDMTASTPNSNNGAVEVFTPQSDNSKSIVSENLIINDAWKILSLDKLSSFKNTFVTIGTTPLSYTLNSSSSPMTIAQRATLTPVEGMTVDILDGSTRGIYRYTNGAWGLQ